MAGGLLLGAAVYFQPFELPLVGAVAAAVVILRRIAKVAALSRQDRVLGLIGPSAGFVIPLGLLVGGIGWLVFTAPWRASCSCSQDRWSWALPA